MKEANEHAFATMLAKAWLEEEVKEAKEKLLEANVFITLIGL